MLCALLRLQSDRTATTTLKRTAIVVVAVGVVVCRAQLTSKEADEVERVHQVYKVGKVKTPTWQNDDRGVPCPLADREV